MARSHVSEAARPRSSSVAGVEPRRPADASIRAAVRTVLFHHLAGIVLAPTLKALADRGIPQLLCESRERHTLDSLGKATHANAGYLRVAMRLLASAGWLTEDRGPDGYGYRVTEAGVHAFVSAPVLYEDVLTFLPHVPRLQHALFDGSDVAVQPLLRHLVRKARQRWRIDQGEGSLPAAIAGQLRLHLDGVVAGPCMVALARSGVLEQLHRGPVDLDDLPGNTASLACVFDLLTTLGWVTAASHRIALTPAGEYAAQIATSYGVTVSYVPTLLHLPALLFGNPGVPRVDEHGNEALVDRALNVWGSGGAHATYFKRVDEAIVEIFSRPILQQPSGICDMGCGDGTFLAHLYSVVRDRTPRGRMLDEHPLVIVGADFNKVARRVTSRTLRRAEIPAFAVVPGDVNRPASLAGELEKRGIDSHDLLHVRSFLDHNRPYSWLGLSARGSRTGESTGAFVYRGALLGADEMEENLVRHLRRWKPYIGRFGLLVLELHTLPPATVALNLDRTPAIAYDATHGYSDQYLVEASVFLRCAREAGLMADERCAAAFPTPDLATVTLNFFTAARPAEG